jgi:hypothetical protein
MRLLVIAVVILGTAGGVCALEKEALQISEDFTPYAPDACYMNYYYYVPCPTSSWFWSFSDWQPGDVIGEWFELGDPSMGQDGAGGPPQRRCDSCFCLPDLAGFRVLDFAGYGTIYPGLWTVGFNVWCADPDGCPVGQPLWSSQPVEFCTAGWNYINVQPALGLRDCLVEIGDADWSFRFLITATNVGSRSEYPDWGCDNISTPLSLAAAMHDCGSLPAAYPRPQVSHYEKMHSGYYGVDFANCPPIWFLDGGDSIGDSYGCVELAWRVYLEEPCMTPCDCDATEPTTWGAIKSMYR